MNIRPATPADHARIMGIYKIAQDYMIASGNEHQWGHSYPSPELIESDIRDGVSYVLCDDEGIHGVFALFRDPESTYRHIEDGGWLNEEPYITIHRVAGDGQRHGIVSCVMDYAKSLSGNIRIDTHADNATMQRALEQNGFRRCGVIHLENGAPRVAYQYEKTGGNENENHKL